MIETRLAKKGEIPRQKEIWKLCFGDDDNFIDFYYANQYKEDETAVLLQDGEIVAMLTMIPTKMVMSDNRNFNAAMLYAIATHPQYQNKGLATQLMDFSNKHLKSNNIDFSILVPAEKHLFDFYYKQGYGDGFYIREILLTRDEIDGLPTARSCGCRLSVITPKEYNQRRNQHCNGRYYIAYKDQGVAYQKKLSQLSGGEIYGIDMAGVQGCMAIERIAPDKILIKEILLPEELINIAIKEIAKLLYAIEYIVRTPAYLGEYLGGSIRPFGMIRRNGVSDIELTPEDLGYLGLAYD